MELIDLSITNFRSIGKADLAGAGQFNVLVGRNNSGKSSVFGALSLLPLGIWLSDNASGEASVVILTINPAF